MGARRRAAGRSAARGRSISANYCEKAAASASNANEFFAQPCAEDEEGPFACIDPTALIEGADAYNASAYPPGYTGEGARCIAMRTNRTGVCGEIGLRSEVRVRVRVRVSQP